MFGGSDTSRKLVWRGGHEFSLQILQGEPAAPGPNQVLVKVRAVGLCGTDLHILSGHFPLAQPPRVLGHEIAGDVVAVGEGVQRVQTGQSVTLDSVVGCGACHFCRRGSVQFCPSGYELGITADGGCQDYLLAPERNVYPVGPRISYEEAAILDAEVWGALRKCGVHPGESVLVLGHGPAGLIACQIARLMGADRVILCGRSPGRLAAARRLGLADRYVSVAEEDLAAVAAEESGGKGIDLVVDCAGTPRSTADAVRIATPGGRVLLYGVYTEPLSQFDLNQVVLKDLTVFGALSDRVGWEEVIGLVDSGALKLKPLITHRFPIEQAAAAYSLMEAKADGVIKAVLLL
jgi:2-desacetyl-2-hydroxyethyl bacteriochlorophyllide A dehydrogenase